MSSNGEANLSETENTCVVCFKNVEIYSVGVCDHAVCYECSTRMRVLCRQNECPICRQDMPKVIFTKEVDSFNILKPKAEHTNLQDRRFGLLFCSASIQQAYYRLLEHNCHICARREQRWPFKNFQQLKDHMRREHELFYCELCVANLKIFTFERRCYTRSDLALHRRKGDVDNTSHRGHPLCEFCDTRYVDSDELFRHLRRDHLYCHFCDADGKHQYYNSYADLRKHFLEEHYLCEEGDCKNEKFTSVFRTDIDLRAHIANVHSRHLSKSATKQARTLELEFTLAPRSRGGRRPARPEREEDDEGAVGYNTYYMEPGGSRGARENNSKSFINPMTSDEFPSLGTTADSTSSRGTSSVTFMSKVTPNPFSGEEFPSLNSSSGPSRSNVTITAHSNVVPYRNSDLLAKASSNNRVPEVTITRTLRGSEKLVKNSQNFPALGSASGNSTVRLSVSSNNSQDRPQSARPNVSIHVNHQANGIITTKITGTPTSTVQVRPKSTEAFPALSRAAIPEVTWVPQKAKRTQEPKNNKVVAAPVLPPSSLNDFPTLLRSGKSDVSTNKRTSVMMPVSNSWVNLNNFNTGTRSAINNLRGELALPDESNKKEVKKKDSSKSNKSKKHEIRINQPKTIEKPDKTDDRPPKSRGTETNATDDNDTKMSDSERNKVKRKKQRDSSNSNSLNEHKTSASNEISAENVDDKYIGDTKPKDIDINTNGIIKKIFELKVDPFQAPIANGDLDDFPALGKNKIPPGFHMKPPPGFDNTNHNNTSNDLTFTSSSGQSYSIVPTNEYHLPPNFEVRNKKLVESFMAVVESGDAVVQFKRFSNLFREGSYSAENYYEHCKDFLGSGFERIFPELLVLLPDIKKQQELYKIHMRSSSKKNLDVCCTCNQIVLVRDLKNHLSNHTLENHFPILG